MLDKVRDGLARQVRVHDHRGGAVEQLLLRGEVVRRQLFADLHVGHGHGHVAVAVADEVGLRAVDVEAGAGGVDEAGGGLAAAACLGVGGHFAFGVVRAVVEGV